MRILIMTAITAVALPFMAVGQTTEEPQQTQGQTKETQTTAPAKGKKMRPAHRSRAIHRKNLKQARTCADRQMLRVALM